MKAGTEKVAPKTSTMTEVLYSKTLEGERTNIGYIQSVSEFLTPPEETTYSALDIPDERMAKGRRKAQATEIPFLYTEEQWDELRAIEELDEDVYIFLKLPDVTAVEEGKSVVFHFTAGIALGMDQIEIDNMLQSKIKLYRSSEIEESKGFPTAK